MGFNPIWLVSSKEEEIRTQTVQRKYQAETEEVVAVYKSRREA